MTDSSTDLPGLDLAALQPWFTAHVTGAGEQLRAEHIAGGKSNLTYRITDGVHSWILRRPPLGHVLATAHDMGREYRVMTALRDTAVPVPETFAHCEDDSVIGAPFYVMADVAGTPYRHAEELSELGPDRTRALAERLVDTLAALHAVDPAEVGLADFGRPEGFLTRQVARWKKQLDASYVRDLPDAEALHAGLAARVAEVERLGSTPGIVHGDYRLDNVLALETPSGVDEIRAVIDWEMATLGDPLTDLALLVLYQRMAEMVGGDGVTDVSRAPGYPTEEEILARYDAASQRDLSRIGFYLALGAFKLAAILEGIHYRYVHGQTVGAGFAGVGDSVEPLLRAGLDALERDRPAHS